MKKRCIRWILPLIAVVALAITATLSAPHMMAHAASTISHQMPISTGHIIPYSFWHN